MLTRLLRRLFPERAQAKPEGQAASTSPYRRAARPSASPAPGSFEILHESRSHLVYGLVADASGLFFLESGALLFVPGHTGAPKVIAFAGLTALLARADGETYRVRMDGMDFTIERIENDGAAVAIAHGRGSVYDFAIGGAHVHWIHRETETDDSDKVIRAVRSTLYRAPLVGSAAGAPELVLTRAASMAHLSADADSVLWVEQEVRGPHRLMALGHVGRTPRELVELRRGPPARRLAVTQDASHFYWSDEGSSGISRIARAGGPVTSLCGGLEDLPLALAADEGTVFAILGDPEGAHRWVGCLAPGESDFTVLGQLESAARKPMLKLGQIAAAGGHAYASDGHRVFRVR